MSPIFTFIVIVLGLLAIANIIVGVANDAINFMNAAWGSRVAPLSDNTHCGIGWYPDRYTHVERYDGGSPQRRVFIPRISPFPKS